jgi:hypothetical protein
VIPVEVVPNEVGGDTPRAARREKLYVIVGSTYDGLLIYAKGSIRRIAGEDTHYFFISAKGWAPNFPEA